MDQPVDFIKILHENCPGNTELRAFKKPNQCFCADIAEVEQRLAEVPEKTEVYIGVARRKGMDGSKAGVLAIPALWVDIDFKDVAEEEARALIANFTQQPSITVESGGGLHLYWLLNQPILEDFGRVEATLRGLAKALKGDVACAEIARVMRLPGTLNRKYDPPRPVTMAEIYTDRRYGLEDFTYLIEEVGPEPAPDPRTSAPTPDPGTSTGPNDPTLATTAIVQAAATPLQPDLTLLDCCAFLAHCRDGAATLPEPEWFAALTNLARLPDPNLGRELCHAISASYPGYTKAETNTKVDHALNGPGPHTCQKIQALGFVCPANCAAKAPLVRLKQTLRPTHIEHDFQVTPSGFFLVRKDQNGNEYWDQLSNFTAEITKEVRFDDGFAEPELHFELAGEHDHQPFPLIRVKSCDFSMMNWAGDIWGAKACILAGWGSKDQVRTAIQLLSANIQQLTVYTHTGWRQVDGAWCYLHGRGAIGANGPVSDVLVDLGDGLDAFHLPDPPDDPADAVQATLGLLDVAPPRVMVPLLAVTYLAVLAESLGIDFGLWVYGATGTFKSSILALCQAHYGDFDRTNLPGAWSSTPNALEKRAFTLKDSLFVVDDYAPQSSSSADYRMRASADRLIRALGNRAGRQRLQSNLQEARTFHPRGLVVSTAELLPAGQSILARIVPLELVKGEVDLAALSIAQNNAASGLFSACMAAFIRRMAQSMGPDLLADLRNRHAGYRQQFQSGGHARIPEALAWIAVGWNLFTGFALEVLGQHLVSGIDHLGILGELGKQHAGLIKQENPADTFLKTLAGLFQCRAVFVKNLYTVLPADDPSQNNMPFDPMNKDVKAQHIGWLSADGVWLFLIPTEVFKVVNDAERRQGGYLGRREDIFRALKNQGLIEYGKQRLTVVRQVGSRRIRVLSLSYTAVFPDEAGSGADGGGGARAV